MRTNLHPFPIPGSSAAEKSAKPAADQTSQEIAHQFVPGEMLELLTVQLELVPDVRQQKVERLRRSIRDGTFRISPHRIADAMLASIAHPSSLAT